MVPLAVQIWKTLETAERSLLDMIAAKECDCSALFEDRNGVKQPETLALKLRADKQETEDFYLEVGAPPDARAVLAFFRVTPAGSFPGNQLGLREGY